jgi:hypothetical protein
MPYLEKTYNCTTRLFRSDVKLCRELVMERRSNAAVRHLGYFRCSGSASCLFNIAMKPNSHDK